MRIFPILSGIVKLNKTPLQLIFYVTNRCNLRCSHCFFWKEINKKTDELTLEEIKKIAKSMNYIPILSLTGGEPFLRTDLSDIVKIFNRYSGVNSLVIPTNGFLTKRIIEATEKISSENRNINIKIDLSVDDIGKKHDENRGVKGVFKNLLKTNKELKKLQKYYRNLLVGCIMTLTNKNQDHILEVYKYIKEKIKPDSVFVNYTRGMPRRPEMANIKLENYIKIISQIKKDYDNKNDSSLFSNLVKQNNLSIYSLVKNTVKGKKYITRCYAGLIDAVLYSNGDVFPCEMLPQKIGNIRDFNYDFKKLWSSKKAKEIRENIRKNRCFCTHECFLTTASLFNFRMLVPLLTRTCCSAIRKPK